MELLIQNANQGIEMQVLRSNDRQSDFINSTIVAVLLLIVTGGCSQFQTASFDEFIERQPSRTQLEGTTIDKAEMARLTNERIPVNQSSLNDDEFDVDRNLISNLPSQVQIGQVAPAAFAAREGYQFQQNEQRNGPKPRDFANDTINVDPSAFERAPTPVNNRLLPLSPSQSNQPLVGGPKPVDFDRDNGSAAKQPFQLVTNQDAFEKARERLVAEQREKEQLEKERIANEQIANEQLAREQINIRPLPQTAYQSVQQAKIRPNPLLPSNFSVAPKSKYVDPDQIASEAMGTAPTAPMDIVQTKTEAMKSSPTETVADANNSFNGTPAATVATVEQPPSTARRQVAASFQPNNQFESNEKFEPKTEFQPAAEFKAAGINQTTEFDPSMVIDPLTDFDPLTEFDPMDIVSTTVSANPAKVIAIDTVEDTDSFEESVGIAESVAAFNRQNVDTAFITAGEIDAAMADAAKIAFGDIAVTDNQPEGQLTAATVAVSSSSPAAPAEPPAPLPWDQQLASTIEQLQSQIGQLSNEQQKAELNSGLTILQTLQTKMTAEGFETTGGNRDYWDFQVDALGELLNESVSLNDTTGPASRAVLHLQHAVTQLRSMANLKIVQSQFCTKVAGYGQYVPVTSTDFRAGQQTLIYCEIENFIPTLESIDGQQIFRTQLKSRFHVTDASGEIVQQIEFPVVEDVARNRRRDFYMHLPVRIGQLQDGSYELFLTIEDLGSNKTVTMESPMKFDVQTNSRGNN